MRRVTQPSGSTAVGDGQCSHVGDGQCSHVGDKNYYLASAIYS